MIICPRFCSQKRKAETEPLENQEDDKGDDDAPKEKETKPEEEAQSTAAEPVAEPKKTEVKVTAVEIRLRKPKPANPYGAWERVRQEVDP